jgi:NADH:ubiquinone oxidoreductase subunit C
MLLQNFFLLKKLVYTKQLIHLLKIAGNLCYISQQDHYENILFVKANDFLHFLKIVKNHWLCRFSQLIEITCIDFPSKSYRFVIIYKLLTTTFNSRISLIQYTNDCTALSSCVHLYNSANWLEREIWDLFGVFFTNHPDLRRILTDYGFVGHPLRKDFPLSGFNEVFFNESIQLVSYQRISLAQEFRDFLTLRNPWLFF